MSLPVLWICSEVKPNEMIGETALCDKCEKYLPASSIREAMLHAMLKSCDSERTLRELIADLERLMGGE